MPNVQRCPFLRAAGIPNAQSLMGRILDNCGSCTMTLKERNRGRLICLNCPLDKCVLQHMKRVYVTDEEAIEYLESLEVYA